MDRIRDFLKDETKFACFDVDEILLGHIENVLPKINADRECALLLTKHGLNPLKIEDISHFGLIAEVLGEVGQRHFMVAKSYSGIQRIVGAKEMIILFERLIGKNRMKFVTSSFPDTVGPKNQMLLEYFGITEDQVTHTSDKREHVKGHFFIDDGQHNIEKVVDDKDTICVMLRKPWNRAYKHENLISINKLEELNLVLRNEIENKERSKSRNP